MNTRITSRWFLVVAVAVTAVLLVSASLNAAVVGHWTLDDPVGTSGTGAVVESQHARNGITAGTVTFGGAGANANTGTAASFSNSVVNVPFNPDLNPASFTAMAWLYPTGGGGHRSPFTSRYDALGTQGYILYINPSNQWDFWTGSGAGWNGLNGGAAAFNTWSHVAISFDAATSTKSIFINGGAPISATQGYAPNTARDLHIGSGGDSGTQYRFPGAVDDFVLFDTALDQTAIQNVMNNSVPDPDVLSAGKSYAYGQNLPGYNGGTQYYADIPHIQALDTYDTGDVTDGAYYGDGTAPAPGPNALLGWGTPVTVPADITIDLESLHAVTGVTVGSHTWQASANGSPDDVTLSFSTDGVTFGSPITQSFFDPATNGQNDFVVDVPGTEARYVKLSFDGGALGPHGTPNKWMLDEVTVHGSADEIPAPTILKPVSVTTSITGDAGSSHLYLLDDNAGFAAAGLQRPVGTGVTLNTGDPLTDALATVAELSGGGHAESWTRGTNFGLPEFVFDLTGGGDTLVESIILWQYGNNGGGANRVGNHTKDFRVILHTEAEGATFDFSTETADLVDIMDVIEQANTTNNVAQLFDFASVQNARYAAVRIDDNYGGEPGIIAGGDRYGLGEVRFVAPAAAAGDIPEPATMALSALALAGLGGYLRKRRAA